MTTAPLPATPVPTWTLTGVADPFVFEWSSNFGFYGSCMLTQGKVWFRAHSACCQLPLFSVGAYHLCEKCQMVQEGGPHQPFMKPRDVGFHSVFQTDEFSTWLSHALEVGSTLDPLANQVAKANVLYGFGRLARSISRFNRPYGDSVSELLYGVRSTATYDDIERVEKDVWGMYRSRWSGWCKNISGPVL